MRTHKKFIVLLKTVLNKKKALKPLEIVSLIVAILVIIPISNFLVEGVGYLLSGNFSLGIAGRKESRKARTKARFSRFS